MIYVILNVLIFLGLLGVLYYMASKYISFSKRVFSALAMGILFGIVLYNIYPKEILVQTKEYFDIVGKSYVALLKMISMPLILVSVTSAIINLKDSKEVSKMVSLIVGSLLSTAAIASIVGLVVTILFKLDASILTKGENEIAAIEKVTSRVATANQNIVDKVVSFIPTNPFLDMTGARATSTIAVVVFCVFIGAAVLGVKRKKPKSAEIVTDVINAAHDVVMRMVTLVLRLTPYGVLALIAGVTATSSYSDIYKLIQFVLASYVALITMYIIHLIIVSLFGYSPFIFIKKALPAISFAFTSRTSAGTLPLTIESQKNMGIEDGIANMAATFGTSIGQNGCAAIYPTMLAVMIAPTIGINPLDTMFILKLVLIVTISSLGVAGVGGGATFAAIIVLSSLGFPLEIVGLLISVEPLIDMGRTALNVNGSMVAGLTTSKILNKVDMNKYNN